MPEGGNQEGPYPAQRVLQPQMFPLLPLGLELWRGRRPGGGHVGFGLGEPRVPFCACWWALGSGL